MARSISRRRPERGREEQAIDPTQRRLAERRLLDALRRFHRSEPLVPDLRVDALVRRVRLTGDARPPGHRGAGALTLDDRGLRDVVDRLVDDGRVERHGHRIRLTGRRPALDPQMRERVDRLLDGLRAAGGAPPRVEGPASRLGIPPPVIDQLRRSGELVAVAPGIDYPRDVHARLTERLAQLLAQRRHGIAEVAAGLRVSRRYAEALLRSVAGDAGPTPRRARPASAGGQSSPAASRASRKAAAAEARSPRTS